MSNYSLLAVLLISILAKRDALHELVEEVRSFLLYFNIYKLCQEELIWTVIKHAVLCFTYQGDEFCKLTQEIMKIFNTLKDVTLPKSVRREFNTVVKNIIPIVDFGVSFEKSLREHNETLRWVNAKFHGVKLFVDEFGMATIAYDHFSELVQYLESDSRYSHHERFNKTQGSIITSKLNENLFWIKFQEIVSTGTGRVATKIEGIESF